MLRSILTALTASLLLVSAAVAQSEQPEKDMQSAKLELGNKAPALEVRDWIKGDAVTKFEKGNVYIIDCWATWCGPCIRMMPHMTETQKKYKDKNVHVIGVAIWERNWDGVAPFVKENDAKMGYSVCRDTEDGKIAETWMKAAGRNGIPSIFIVDQKGTIAWMGHPAEMDKPLEQIVKGDWSVDKAKKEAAAAEAADKMVRQYVELFRGGSYEKAYKLGHEIVKGAGKDNAPLLNFIAWGIVDPTANVENRDFDLALSAARRACEVTENKDAAILDTLARCHFCKGDVDNAVKVQKSAVELAPEEMKADLQKALEEYKKAMEGGKEG